MSLHRRFGADGWRFYPFRLQKYNIFLKYTKYYDDFWKILGLYASFHQFLSVFYRLN